MNLILLNNLMKGWDILMQDILIQKENYRKTIICHLDIYSRNKNKSDNKNKSIYYFKEIKF